VKFTKTCFAPVIVTTHVSPEELSQPAQPDVFATEFRAAVRVTIVPVGKAASQTFPRTLTDEAQLNAPGTLVTVPSAKLFEQPRNTVQVVYSVEIELTVKS
jgi:hypothetical protein